MNNRILVIDDKENICKLLKTHLNSEGFQVDIAETGEKGVELFGTVMHDLVITDVKMPGMDGLEVLRRVKEMNPDTVVLLITAFADMDDAIAAMKMGAFDYLKKPFRLEEIQATVEKALENRRLLSENRLLRQEVETRYNYENIVGKSKVMQEIFIKISRVASAGTTVMITGETGTGKELVAKALHYNSPRKRQQLVTVNCGAIPVTLIESELFGHVRGAFTDAIATKPGRFEEADGGTIFLDEIGELDMSVQGKLLRILQDGEISRLGDVRTRKVDVRVVCATNRDLEQEVLEGRFRKDLFFRINVVPIKIPPLRDRREDIPLLLRHYLDRYCGENNRIGLNFSTNAMSLLFSYAWPGNVRELMNVVERCVLMAEGTEISVEDLPSEITHVDPCANGGSPAQLSSVNHSDVLSLALPSDTVQLKKVTDYAVIAIEREMIIRALRVTDGNKDRAARLLGISRRSLFYKIKEYEI